MIPEYDGWRAVPAHLYTRTQLSDLDLPRTPGGPVRAYVTAAGAVHRRETFDLYDITESDPSPATGRQLEAAAARRTRSAYRCADCGAHTERPAIHTRDGDPPAYRSLCLACRHIADLRAFHTRLAALRAAAAERAFDWVALDSAAVLHITVLTPQPTESGRRRPPVAVCVDAVTPSGADLFSHAMRLRHSRHPLVPDAAADWHDALPVLRTALQDRHLIVWTGGDLDPIVPALLPESATPAQLACYRRERAVSELSGPLTQWRGELNPVSTRTTIEWTRADDGAPGRTWNPVTGCTKVSEGCEHCYAESIARRFAGTKAFPDGFAVTLHPERLDDPDHWRTPSRVFVNSMSDLFHDAVPEKFLTRVFDAMEQNPQHTFLVLTKRPARMCAFVQRRMQAKREFAARFDQHASLGMRLSVAAAQARAWAAHPPANVWLGVSVEDQHWADIRVPVLMRTPAAVRFLSCEPLLGPIDLRAAMWTLGDQRGHGLTASFVHRGCCENLHGLDWVIAGAESGPGARPMDPDWVRCLRDQCASTGVAFFYKQDADRRGRKIPTPQLDGRTWTQMPTSATR